MHVTLAGTVFIVALLFATAGGLYRYRQTSHSRQWWAQWRAFLRGKPGLDRGLDRIWHLLQR